MFRLSKLLEKLEDKLDARFKSWLARNKAKLPMRVPAVIVGWYFYGMFLNSLRLGIASTFHTGEDEIKSIWVLNPFKNWGAVHKVPGWFSRIDKASHIYSVYSDDPSASQSFADFKADEDSEHLKLLFCIDALNEGIHVENVSGVILLRPTVSPIIYKQQIGRALAAGKRGNAVIWDIVNNIENLYSIGAVEEEMLVATT